MCPELCSRMTKSKLSTLAGSIMLRTELGDMNVQTFKVSLLAIHINILKFDLVACTAILKLAPHGMER